MRLKDKVAVITGASRGIGRAIALEFAKEGAKVVVNYSNSAAQADQVVSDIKGLGSDAIAVQADVSNEEQVISLMNQAAEKFGQIDILVNNAGIVFDIHFKDKTIETFKLTLEVNLIGTFLCCKHVLKHMEKGHIVNMSSTNGIYSFYQDSMDYDASKAGIITMTKSLAKELSPNILVNAIAPGWVDTDMNKDLPADFMKSEAEKVFLKRFAKPEEIARVAVFLASDDASYVNGNVLVVDGGSGV